MLIVIFTGGGGCDTSGSSSGKVLNHDGSKIILETTKKAT